MKPTRQVVLALLVLIFLAVLCTCETLPHSRTKRFFDWFKKEKKEKKKEPPKRAEVHHYHHHYYYYYYIPKHKPTETYHHPKHEEHPSTDHEEAPSSWGYS